MKRLLWIAVIGVLAGWVGVAEAQITCGQYGQFTTCDGPRGKSATQLDLGGGMGILSDQDGNVEPYAILPQKPARTLPAPASPKSPASPLSPSSAIDLSTGGTSDLIMVPQVPSPILAPGFSFGGEAPGQ